jgi:hypothetical protein
MRWRRPSVVAFDKTPGSVEGSSLRARHLTSNAPRCPPYTEVAAASPLSAPPPGEARMPRAGTISPPGDPHPGERRGAEGGKRSGESRGGQDGPGLAASNNQLPPRATAHRRWQKRGWLPHPARPSRQQEQTAGDPAPRWPPLGSRARLPPATGLYGRGCRLRLRGAASA